MITELGVDSADMDLDTSKHYGLVRGLPGAHFVQNGEYFGALGNALTLDEATGVYVPAKNAEEVVSVDENLVEFDMDSIATVADFDLFSAALKKADSKHAKTAIKVFATEVVGMEKLSTRKGLSKLIDEVRAEYKAVLEMDIE